MPRKKEESFNGKPMSHWRKEARRLVVAQLLRAADVDTRSLPGRLASERLLEIAISEGPDLVDELRAERHNFRNNMFKVLASFAPKRTPIDRACLTCSKGKGQDVFHRQSRWPKGDHEPSELWRSAK